MNEILQWVLNDRAMETITILFPLNTLIDLISGKGAWKALQSRKDDLFGYVAFLAAAHFMDYLMLNDTMGWDYSTRTVVSLVICAREILRLFNLGYELTKLDIPVLRTRLNQIISIGQEPKSQLLAHEDIEEIRNLLAELRTHRAISQAQGQPPYGGGTES